MHTLTQREKERDTEREKERDTERERERHRERPRHIPSQRRSDKSASALTDLSHVTHELNGSCYGRERYRRS